MVDLEQGVFNGDICQVLQAWAEGADLGQNLPGSASIFYHFFEENY